MYSNASDIRQEYLDFIGQKEFPCVGAKAALSKNQVNVFIADHLACPHNDQDIINFIYEFVDSSRDNNELYVTAAVVFRAPGELDEEAFENLFWKRLQALSDIDALKYNYDARVARNPELTDFSFSLKAEAFYVIGLSPGSSRNSRRFKYPSMVFNPHVQFDRLKEINKYEPLKHAIRNRDVLFSGSVNPMLADFGESSEAFQYTGIQHDEQWKCPFIAKHSSNDGDTAA
ncbi:MAG: guanitoxin biosynthesis heme-dependent pre-guanitoxin N-hydroxylase GntA [Chryseolinea sp.]